VVCAYPATEVIERDVVIVDKLSTVGGSCQVNPPTTVASSVGVVGQCWGCTIAGSHDRCSTDGGSLQKTSDEQQGRSGRRHCGRCSMSCGTKTNDRWHLLAVEMSFIYTHCMCHRRDDPSRYFLGAVPSHTLILGDLVRLGVGSRIANYAL
jgi:hypothetical protein